METRHGQDDETDILSTVRRYFERGPKPHEHIWEELCAGDKFLAWLWMRGFKVVPLTGEDLGRLTRANDNIAAEKDDT